MSEQLPRCDNNLFLPEGLHDYSLTELKFSFASSSEGRANLFAVFELFLEKIKPYKNDIVDVFVDGTFISQVAKTDDIDILIVTDDEETEVKIYEIATSMLRHGIDAKITVKDGIFYDSWFQLFSNFKVPEYKHLTGVKKGYVRLISWR